jgi:hypothetical protein
VVELGYEGVLQPIDHHLGEDHKDDRLWSDATLMIAALRLTDKIASTRLFPLTKDLGRKAISLPAISIMFRSAITDSINPSWKRSTMSVISVAGEPKLSPAHMI